MGCVPPVGGGFFPLDEELALVPGQLTPNLHEQLVRLGTWVPFRPAAALLSDFMRLGGLSEATARRQTEAAGAVWEAAQTAVVEAYEHRPPPAPAGPERLVLSADGAMVPLVGGTWAEVKTLAIGEVPAVPADTPVEMTALSYFSRLAESADFTRLALVETHPRGVESARAVAAVTDGAEWLQGFIDFHRADALRILDFPHAAEYIAAAGAAALGDGQSPPPVWLAAQLHALKHSGPAPVLAELQALRASHPAAADRVTGSLMYLEKRQPLMAYPAFQAAGWPIGSGSVESANKLVVEARLKGSGMHWQRRSVNSLLALRTIVCNDRWRATWPAWVVAERTQRHTRQHTRRQARRAQQAPPPLRLPKRAPAALPPALPPASPGRKKPAPDHPWRRLNYGKGLFKPKSEDVAPKL